MSEQITAVLPVSTRTLLHAVIRLDARKHPEKVTEIQREIDRRRMRRAA